MNVFLMFCLALCSAIPLAHTNQLGRARSKVQLGCLFLHGLGQKAPSSSSTYELYNDDSTVKTSGLNYWGLKTKHNPAPKHCDMIKVIQADTVLRGWDNAILQEEFCHAVKIMEEKAKKVVVFTHSMGNLVLAGGIFHKREGCQLIQKPSEGESNVVWYGIEGPLAGSEITLWLRDQVGASAARRAEEKSLLHIVDTSAMQGTVKLEPRLLAGTASLTPDYVSYEPRKHDEVASSTQQKLQLNCNTAKESIGYQESCVTVSAIASEYLSGELCGSHQGSAKGYTSHFKSWAITKAVQTYVPQFVENQAKVVDEKTFLRSYPFATDWVGGTYDAFVPAESCLAPGHIQDFQDVPTHKWFAASTNHAEGACMVGDGKKATQKPCAWIGNMIQAEKKKVEAQATGKGITTPDIEEEETDRGIKDERTNRGTTSPNIEEEWTHSEADGTTQKGRPAETEGPETSKQEGQTKGPPLGTSKQKEHTKGSPARTSKPEGTNKGRRDV